MATISSSTPGAVGPSGMRDIVATAKLKAGIVVAKVVKYRTRYLDKPERIVGQTRRDLQAAAMPSATSRVTPP
ncbi:hypothetical protein [Azospirillum sp. sgz301742]